MTNAKDIAKIVLEKCIARNAPINNLQLQKLLYLIQRDALKENQIAFYDSIEAWAFGACIPCIYYEYGNYGAMTITRINPKHEKPTDEVNEIINRVVTLYCHKAPWEFETFPAYEKIYNNGNGEKAEIPMSLIKDIG